MKEYLAKNPVKEDEKIAVVCHSRLIASMTASGVGPNDIDHAKGEAVLQDFYFPSNCEI
jgi:hypothetical protein